MPAAAPDPKATVMCYACFIVTSKDSSDNKVRGGEGEKIVAISDNWQQSGSPFTDIYSNIRLSLLYFNFFL